MKKEINLCSILVIHRLLNGKKNEEEKFRY